MVFRFEIIQQVVDIVSIKKFNTIQWCQLTDNFDKNTPSHLTLEKINARYLLAVRSLTSHVDISMIQSNNRKS